MEAKTAARKVGSSDEMWVECSVVTMVVRKVYCWAVQLAGKTVDLLAC